MSLRASVLFIFSGRSIKFYGLNGTASAGNDTQADCIIQAQSISVHFLFQNSKEKTMRTSHVITATMRSTGLSAKTWAGLLMVALFAFIQVPTSTAQGNISTDENNVVLGGYDVVNYFTANQAVRGSVKHSTTYQGATFYFVSNEHKQMFVANPEKYMPKYGGYCAYAVAALDKKVPVDPQTFKIYNGELLLFFNDYSDGTPVNTIVPWNQDEQDMKKKAEANWKSLSKK